MSKIKHGQSKYNRNIYNIWCSMMSRCNNQKDPSYHNYGGRGITVCERWSNVALFVSDMGRKPTKHHTLGRRDNNGNYCPENCKWETRREQARNTRTNRILEFRGQKKTVAEWGESSPMKGFTPKLISSRLSMGWPVERALTAPVMKNQYATKY